MKNENKRRARMAAKIAFVAYLMLLSYFLFFADSWGRTNLHTDYQYNLTPFKEILRFWNYRELLTTRVVCLNLIGNVAAFLPFGLLLPMLFPKCRNALCTIALSFGFSLIIELIQLFARVGSFDVDDMILNTLGGAIGVILYLTIKKIWSKRHEEKE